MRKLTYLNIFVALSLLSGCATIHNLHNKLASAAVLKYKLANGNTVYVDTNVVPTTAWGCSEVGTPMQRNWAWLKTKSQFEASSPEVYFTRQAINYADQHKLDPNYINLGIPEETSDNGITVGMMKKATASFYQCKKINPDHLIGGERKTSVTIQ